MMSLSRYFFKTLSILAMMLFLGAPAFADETQDKIKAIIDSKLKAVAADATVVKAVEAQNAAHASFDAAKIDELDKTWRAEAEKGGGKMTGDLLANPLSAFLKKAQSGMDGLIVEVFVMDNKGMNVGASAMTSDYMQGDEDKWSKSFGANAPFIDAVDEDASTGAFVSQVSLPVLDAAGKPIGAVTFSVDVGKL